MANNSKAANKIDTKVRNTGNSSGSDNGNGNGIAADISNSFRVKAVADAVC